MLLNLHVKNLALIEEVDVDFSKGLVVLTGETGAGKSLILGSIGLALGEKANKNIIRTGCDYALVELAFSCDSVILDKLKQLDISSDDETQVVVSRKITNDRSVAKINGETVNLKVLKDVMSLLVNIHGQNDNQTLLKVKNHLDFIDSFGNDQVADLKQSVKNEYNKYLDVKKQIEEVQIDDATLQKELEFAKYEINEIESAAIIDGEDEELEKEFKLMSNAQNTSSSLAKIYDNLKISTESNTSNIIDLIDDCINQIHSLDDTEEIVDFRKRIYEMESIAAHLSSDIKNYNDTLNFDPQRVKEVEDRLDLINKLKIKYGNNLEQIQNYLKDRKEFVSKIENIEEERANLDRKLGEVTKNLKKYCDELSIVRKDCALKFEKQVEKSLSDLNFLSSEFKVDFYEKDFSQDGTDNVVFMLSTNPGEPIKPLAEVASGGELSRIMLAIKSVMAREDDVDTLIFDEIDAGISGNTALKVAEKLNNISRSNQVICISHLAQIAAMADHHYLIKKSVKDNHTFTSLDKLDEETSIEELARISFGEQSQVSLDHAKELKRQAISKK